VKITIILSVKPAQPILQIEKWEPAPVAGRRPSTREVPNNLIPTKTQEITIIPNTVTGAPLALEFEKIFLHQVVLPESDITFTGQELLDWAAIFWRVVRYGGEEKEG